MNNNNNRNAIAIFESDLRNFASLSISMITGTPWSHAAICVNGVWYDSSETRGYFDKMDIDLYDNRWCIIAEFDGDLTEWLESMKGKKYNWKGIYEYPFVFLSKRKDDQFYCFQAAWDAAWYSIYREHFTPPKVSGDSLKYFMKEMKNSNFRYQQGLKEHNDIRFE